MRKANYRGLNLDRSVALLAVKVINAHTKDMEATAKKNALTYAVADICTLQAIVAYSRMMGVVTADWKVDSTSSETKEFIADGNWITGTNSGATW